MRLLVVTQYFWPETFGINRQVQDLVAQGVKITVLTGKPNYPDGNVYTGYTAWGVVQESLGDVNIIRVPLLPRGRGSSLRLALNYLSFVFFASCYGPWLLRRQHFDAILVYAPSPILQAIPAVFLSWMKRTPLVLWVQDLWPQSLSATGHVRNSSALWLVDQVVRWIYRSTDLLLVQSKAFVNTVKLQASPEARVRHFPNSSDPIMWMATASKDSTVSHWVSRMRDQFSIVFTGNVGTAQSMQTIVDAAVICSDDTRICFFVVGTGSESAWLAKEVKDLGLTNLILTGWLPAKAMPEIWSAASALLVTLRDDPIFRQTIPSKLQCYLAAGKPIIACLGGEGAQTVVEACAGLVCPPEDARALAAAAKKLVEMPPNERLHLGSNGQQYFMEHFDPKVLTTDLIAMMSELISDLNQFHG